MIFNTATLSLCLSAALISFASIAGVSRAEARSGDQPTVAAEAAETKLVTLGIGLGWHICDERTGEPPPLPEAYLCEGLVATPENVTVELTRKPARKPSWLFYEGSYSDKTKFQDIVSTLELNVAYAEVEGVTYAYVDGRLISEKAGKKTEPIYFRFSAEGGFEKLQYSSAYGARTLVTVGGIKSEYAPYVAVQAPK